jgi:hypothetical protein
MRSFLFLQELDHSSTVMQQARLMCIDAALRIAEICRRHLKAYGSEHMNTVHSVGASLALHTLLDAGDNLEHHPALIDLYICLRALGRRWPMIMGMMRMSQHYARQKKYTLPPEVVRLLTQFGNEDWDKRQTRKLISIYPQPAMTAKFRQSAGGAKDMSRFLEEMEQMKLNDV